MDIKSAILIITVVVIYTDAGVITNASDPKLDASLTDSNRQSEKVDKLSRPPKKYTDVGVSRGGYKKTYENTIKLSLSKKFLILNSIPRIINDTEETRMRNNSNVLSNDIAQSEMKNFNNNLQAVAVNDKTSNQRINESVVEYLDLDLYPNVLDEDVVTSTKNISNCQQLTDFADQIHKQNISNTVLISDDKEKYIADEKEAIRNNEPKVIPQQNKLEPSSVKQNLDINMTSPIKHDGESISEGDKKDLDEFVFVNNDESIPGIATGNDFDYFDVAADILIDEPRFKRAVNIIEEENLGTTASGLKYTGRNKILNNELYFKNINS